MLVNERSGNSSILVFNGQTSNGIVSLDDHKLEEYVVASISPLISVILSSDAKKQTSLNKSLSEIGILVGADSKNCNNSVMQAKEKLTSICDTLTKVVNLCTQACLEPVSLDMFPPYKRDKARRLLDQCVEIGWLDDHYRPVEGTQTSFKAVLAYHIGDTILGLSSRKWKIFNSLWHVPNLRQAYFEAMKYGSGYAHLTEIENKIKL